MWLLAALLPLALVLIPQAATDEAVLRGLVQQYYEAQNHKDADKSLGFWSTAANPRMSREGFVAMFGASDAQYTVEVQSVSIKDDEAHVRVALEVARTIVRDNTSTVLRQSLLNAELWRREGTSWKLLREGSIAEDFADDLLAAPPADRAALMAANTPEINSAMRYVLAQRASMIASTQKYARAREIFELVLALAQAAHDRRSESETLQNIANASYYLKDYESATDFYQQRLALSHEMRDDEATAASLVGLATISYSRGEYTPAVASYREALGIYEKRDDSPAIGRTLVSVGNVQYLQAEYDEAVVSYRRALTLLMASLDLQGAVFARNGLARVFAAQGDLAAALDYYGQALSEARARGVNDPRALPEVASALESIGDLYFRLGNTDQARIAFDESRRLIDKDAASAGRVLSSLGLTELVAGRFDASLADYTDSRTRYELAQDPEGIGRAWIGIGFSQTARQKFADAVTAYRTAIRLFEAQRDNESSGRAWLGLSLAQSGAADHTAALESAQKVRVIAEGVKSDDLSWRANVRIGEALRKLSRLDEAHRSFDEAIATIDRLAADAPTNPQARAQLDDSASAWSGLAFTLAGQGDAAGALAAAEARRAHLRRVQLAGFQRDITRGATTEEQVEEQGIVRELISTRAQLRAEQALRKPDSARLERLQQQLATLIVRRADQQSRLYARLPALQQWRGVSTITAAEGKRDAPKPPSAAGGERASATPKPPTAAGAESASAPPKLPAAAATESASATPKPPTAAGAESDRAAPNRAGPAGDDIAALVTDPRTIVVEYLVTDDELLALTVTHGENGPDVAATVVPVNRRDLADEIADAMQPSVLKDAAAWRKRSTPIAAAVLAPIAARLETHDQCVIVADDLLWKIPFEALPHGESDLAAVTHVTYATSLATLTVQRRAAAAQSPPDRVAAAVVAAPVIPAAIRAQITLTQQGWKEPDGEIALAAAQDIGKIYGEGVTLRTGADATEAAVRALIETSDVLHVSAPLLMSGPTPLFSSLLLGGAPPDKADQADKSDGFRNDGRWEVREWFGANARARVLVISDAASFGVAGIGGSMDALAWAAAAAGVPSLLIGRWPADGFNSDALVDAFHSNLAKGGDPTDAWRDAMAAARGKSANGPAGWAGFRFVGGK